MKSILLTFIIAFTVSNSIYSQCSFSEDYSNTTGWTQIGTNVEIINGQLKFINGAADGYGSSTGTQRRVYKSLGTTLNSNDVWSAEFEFTPLSVGAHPGPYTGHALLALTAGTQEPFNNCPNLACSGFPIGTQDGIMVSYLSPNPGSGELYFSINTKNNFAEQASLKIVSTTLNITYYIRLERTSSTNLILSVFSDSARTNHIVNSPITETIPSSVQGLNTVQHGNIVRGDYRRRLTGSIDNLCINFNLPCTATASTDTQVTCSSYTWIDGNTYTSSNNTATQTLTNAAGCDSVVTLDLTINNSSTGTDTRTECNSYTWIDGNVYSSNNNSATFTLTNVVGCDSVVTLDLTINNSNASIDNQLACDSYTWVDGNTYTSSNNTATQVFTNIAGCDSVVILNLTITNSSSSIDTQIACDSYTWIDGNTYTTSNNTATQTFTNAVGCDSVVTLALTINNSSTGIDSHETCDSYLWIDGNTYTASNNSATQNLTAAAGCDSIVTLDLTIHNSNTGIDTQIACNSYTWIDGNTYTASNNTATQTFTNAVGCDSVLTLNLTINNSNTGTDTQIACDSYIWIDGNVYSSNNNTATFTLTNAAGCDSVVTLNLTINKSSTSIDTHIACNSFTWIDGNTYTSSNSTATQTFTNTVGCDSIVTLDLTINNSNTDVDTQVACNSYTWIDGNVYSSNNNTTTFTLTNAAGCDSVVTLNLTINISNTGTDSRTECNSLTWIDGNVYTANNNTATFTLTNAVGCDSVVTLDLTINYSNTGIDTQIGCDSFTWIDGNAYSANNNTATFTLTNAIGCDSVVTLNLTINNSSTSTDTQVTCNTYTWLDGIIYTASNNTATQIFTNAVGCDSVVTLDLTINNNTSTDTQVACNTLTWIDGNVYTTNNNIATFTLTNAAGCDSVVTLDLIINTSNTGIDTQIGCDSFTWIDGNAYSANNNTATFTLTNATGCDSVVTLDLTIESLDLSVTQSSDTLTANESGATYQWIDCGNGNTVLPGDTNQSYIATSNGDFAVIITTNSCSDTSACYSVVDVGLIENDFENNLLVYPNPTDGNFAIDLGKNYQRVTITITDVTGRLIQSNTYNNTQLLKLKLEEPAGVYFVEIVSKNNNTVIRLIKK